MKLFKYEGYRVVISEEALILKPFKTIWKRDKSSTKEKALAELGFIYFFCDPRSDYMFIIDEEDRKNQIIEQEGLTPKWKPDKTVLEGITLYKYLTQTASSLLLEDTKAVIEKVRNQLKEIDLTQTDEKGRPVYTLNTVVSTIKQIPQLSKELIEAERLLGREIDENTRMRGSGAKKLFEDGFDEIIKED